MTKLTDIRLCDVQGSTQAINYRAPMKFGGRVVTDVVMLDVAVEVETRDGRRGRGLRLHADGQRLGLAQPTGPRRKDRWRP